MTGDSGEAVRRLEQAYVQRVLGTLEQAIRREIARRAAELDELAAADFANMTPEQRGITVGHAIRCAVRDKRDLPLPIVRALADMLEPGPSVKTARKRRARPLLKLSTKAPSADPKFAAVAEWLFGGYTRAKAAERAGIDEKSLQRARGKLLGAGKPGRPRDKPDTPERK